MLFSQTRHKQNQTHKTIKFIHNLIIHICFGVIFEPFYNACVPLLPSLYWTASLLLHRVSYLRCHCASSPLLSWCCWQVLTMTVESCWRCTCRLQDEGEQRWRNTVKSGMTGERQRESKGDRVCFIWMCTCAQPCLDWSWMFTMGNSQHKLYYSRMQMRKRRCRTVTARQERSNAGTEERWNQKLRNIKTLLHTAGHGGGEMILYSWWSLWDIILNPALHCSCFAESFCGLWVAARVGEVVLYFSLWEKVQIYPFVWLALYRSIVLSIDL